MESKFEHYVYIIQLSMAANTQAHYLSFFLGGGVDEGVMPATYVAICVWLQAYPEHACAGLVTFLSF